MQSKRFISKISILLALCFFCASLANAAHVHDADHFYTACKLCHLDKQEICALANTQSSKYSLLSRADKPINISTFIARLTSNQHNKSPPLDIIS